MSSPVVEPDAAPLRVAIVGSGPGGFYTAGRLFKNFSRGEILVDMFEKFPVPHGLVRYGVAPDHPEVKVSRGPIPAEESLSFDKQFLVVQGY